MPHDLTIVEDEHVGNGRPAQQLLAGFRERLYPGSSSKVLVRRTLVMFFLSGLKRRLLSSGLHEVDRTGHVFLGTYQKVRAFSYQHTFRSHSGQKIDFCHELNPFLFSSI